MKLLHEFLDGKKLLVLTGDVEDDFATVHHEQAIPESYRLIHIMGDLHRGKPIFADIAPVLPQGHWTNRRRLVLDIRDSRPGSQPFADYFPLPPASGRGRF